MSIAETVDKIFKKKTNYAEADQVVDQAASLRYLSTDLYSDSKRFVYELLQNADDSGVTGQKVKVAAYLFGNKMVIAHTGKPFNDADVRGVSGVDNGQKKNDPDKTGFKGIGFKAVFGQSDHVTIFTDGEYFRFDSSYEHSWNKDWAESQQVWEEEENRKFEIPWQIIPINTQESEIDPDIHKFITEGDWQVATIVLLKNVAETKAAIEELASNVNMYLFLKNVESIEFNTGEKKTVSILLTAEGYTILKLNDQDKAKWLKKTIILEIPQETQKLLKSESDMPEKLKSAEKVEIVIAAKIGKEGLEALKSSDQRLYAYLPTEETGYALPVLVNAAFYTAANREELHKDSLWNKWLFSCIPTEILRWIAELVQTDIQFSAYNLLPKELAQVDSLTKSFNDSYKTGVKQIPFILNTDNQLLKVEQSLIDITFLSQKDFIGAELIRAYKISDGSTEISANPFIAKNDNEKKLVAIGVAYFDWKGFSKMLASSHFLDQHNLSKNKELIAYVKNLHDNGHVSSITVDVLKSWTFIYNQNGELKSPKDVFFPAPDEQYDEETEISYIHPDLNVWSEENQEIKLWLEGLGVEIKSDLTFLMKSILPYATTYSKQENAIGTVRDIFNLFKKGEIGPDILKQLSQLQLLTKEGNLVSADQTFFSNEYQPYLNLEPSLDKDIYLSPAYLTVGTSIEDWKAFFHYFGVKERIGLLRYNELISNEELVLKNFREAYLKIPKYTPVVRTFTADSYTKLVTLSLLDHTVGNFQFSRLFWEDVIQRVAPKDLQDPARAFWGDSGYPGRDSGNDVSNYLKWYISNINCIPTSISECMVSGKVFVNGAEDTALAVKYLPVFSGPALNADWRAFFNFRPRLELPDYLDVLAKIADDPDDITNKSTIQDVYAYLLDNLSSWSSEQLTSIETWAPSSKFADIKGDYQPAELLHFYMDGNSSIFDGKFNFIQISKANQKHPDLEQLLRFFKITLLRQSEFKLISPGASDNNGLHSKLKQILPYWAKWMEKEAQSGYEEMFYSLQQKFEGLSILESDDLIITDDKTFSRKVVVHFVKDILYTLKPWDESKVMYILPTKLCEIFGRKKDERELSFLLTTDIEKIITFFTDQQIGLPPDKDTIEDVQNLPSTDGQASTSNSLDFALPKESYQSLWTQSLARNAELIANAGDDSKTLLISGLKHYNTREELNVFHFSHLENAVSIIQQAAIKSRAAATFKDSAGSGIIAQTDNERKEYARFYFRPKTPTQHYVENLGRAEDSIAKIHSDPLCPVPVFFIFPLEEIIDSIDWSVSIGSLASPQVEYGNTIDILSRFDFDGVYKQLGEISANRFIVASQQEFLVKDELNLSNVDYRLGVQNEQAKQSLLTMLNDNQTWESRIIIDATLYQNENPRVKIAQSSSTFYASLSKKHGGHFILQNSSEKEWKHIKGKISDQYNDEDWLTSTMSQEVTLEGNIDAIALKLFYLYKGKTWLIHTNTQNYYFDYSFVKTAISDWFNSEDSSGKGIISALRQHPELSYWFDEPIPGSDNLTLETHTLAVIDNFKKFFKTQNLFENDKIYLLCLALHDIGKPSAILAGDKNNQHHHTLLILDQIKDLLPIDANSFLKMTTLIDGDPIGKYLDTRYNSPISEACKTIHEMAAMLNMKGEDFWELLTVYYQCDAAGYNFLQKRLFLTNDDDSIEFHEDGTRLLFKNGYEEKFMALEDLILR
jgi:hypothetical protein